MIALTLMMFLFLLISSILVILNIVFSNKKLSAREKMSPFECGFDPLASPRLPFSIHFYMISIIFLIFDVEIIIFLPIISSYSTNLVLSWSSTSLIFILILLMGVYIEWNDGALAWLK